MNPKNKHAHATKSAETTLDNTSSFREGTRGRPPFGLGRSGGRGGLMRSYSASGNNGFAIGRGHSHADESVTDARDAEYLYEALTNEVVPLYYDRDIDGLPRHWIKRMMNSISSLGWRFSSHRMVADYVLHAYLPAAGGLSVDMNIR